MFEMFWCKIVIFTVFVSLIDSNVIAPNNTTTTPPPPPQGSRISNEKKEPSPSWDQINAYRNK